jgi:hypothetical protein
MSGLVKARTSQEITMSKENSDFEPRNSGWGLQPIGQGGNDAVKDVHDTFKVDDKGNISGGHTTIVTDKGSKGFGWD